MEYTVWRFLKKLRDVKAIRKLKHSLYIKQLIKNKHKDNRLFVNNKEGESWKLTTIFEPHNIIYKMISTHSHLILHKPVLT